MMKFNNDTATAIGKYPRRGEVYYFDLGERDTVTNEKKGTRPCLILSNNTGNKNGNTLIIAPLSHKKPTQPTHAEINIEICKGSVTTEQLLTVDKTKIISECICFLQADEMKEIEKALKISLGLENLYIIEEYVAECDDDEDEDEEEEIFVCYECEEEFSEFELNELNLCCKCDRIQEIDRATDERDYYAGLL